MARRSTGLWGPTGLLILATIALLLTGCTSRGEFSDREEEEAHRIEQLKSWAEAALGGGLDEPDIDIGGGVCNASEYPRRSHVRVGYSVDDPEQAIRLLADWLEAHGVRGMDRTDEPSAVYFRIDGLLSTVKTGAHAFVDGNLHLTFTTGCYED